MKYGAAYLRKGFVYLRARSKTTVGVWIGDGVVYRIQWEALAGADSKILSVLNGSSMSVPHPKQDEWKPMQEPMLVAAGVKSWKTFITNTRVVAMTLENGVVLFEPTKDDGKQGGSDLPEKNIYVNADSGLLGRKLQLAFEACE